MNAEREAGRATGVPSGPSGRQLWPCRIDVTESLTRWRKGLIVRAGPPQMSGAEPEHRMGLRKGGHTSILQRCGLDRSGRRDCAFGTRVLDRAEGARKRSASPSFAW